MTLTNLDVVTVDRCGQERRQKLYRDDSGTLFVGVPQLGTIRKRMVPYSTYRKGEVRDGYIIERTLT